MLGHLIKKEILEHLMSLRFSIATVLCLIVILCSLYVRGRQYLQNLDDYHQDTVATRTDMENERWPWRMAFGWKEVNLSPTPMKIFVRGIDRDNRVTMKIASNDTALEMLPDLVNTTEPLFPELDLVFFTGIIMSLLALIFGYDLVCGEKERGTLKLVLSYNIPRDQVLLAKWVGGYVTLVLPYLIAVLAMMILLMTQPGIVLSSGQWNRLIGLVFLSLLYIASVYSLAVWISTITHRASTSIIILATLWVVLILAIPNLSPHVARLMTSNENTLDLNADRLAQRERIWQRDVVEKMRQYDKENGLGPNFKWRDLHWDDKAQRLIGRTRWLYKSERQAEANEAIVTAAEKIDQKIQSTADAELALNRWLARLSPFGCFAMAAAELSDTGVAFRRRQLDQVNEFSKVLTAHGVQEHLSYIQLEIKDDGEQPPWRDVRAVIPRFNFVPPAAAEYVKWAAMDAGILAALTVAFFMLSYIAFLRYDVR